MPMNPPSSSCRPAGSRLFPAPPSALPPGGAASAGPRTPWCSSAAAPAPGAWRRRPPCGPARQGHPSVRTPALYFGDLHVARREQVRVRVEQLLEDAALVGARLALLLDILNLALILHDRVRSLLQDSLGFLGFLQR
eukprot:212875-Pyramimonas_sp.AAC.1